MILSLRNSSGVLAACGHCGEWAINRQHLSGCIKLSHLFKPLLKNNQPIVVHCEWGLGRTGTIIAGYLTTCGFTAQKAIDYIRMLRPGSVETEEQEAVIYEYERIYHLL